MTTKEQGPFRRKMRGEAFIKSGKTTATLRRIAKKLGIPFRDARLESKGPTDER